MARPEGPVVPPSEPAKHQSLTGLSRLQQAGIASWSTLGIIALGVVIATALSALSGIVVPLVVAIILGAVLEPVVTGLRRLRFPGPLAAVCGLLLAVGITGALVTVVVAGFVSYLPEISQQLRAGWSSLSQWVRSMDVDSAWLEHVRKTVEEAVPQLSGGIFGLVADTLYGVISLSVGCFFAMFFLFFVLKDGDVFPSWFAGITAQDEDLVVRIASSARASIRGYFRGTAITALVTAPFFVIPLLLLQVPLAIPIIIVYFALSFVPYVGAWITGVFAVLIAFGSGGVSAAVIITLALFISNGTIQSMVNSWALGSTLKLHPVAIMLTTLIGGVVAGILGMILGPPLLSAAQKTRAAILDHWESPDGGNHATSQQK